ncbi:hydrogenase iron-sulfur subunit [Desulfovibrio litoralis]|uniref:Putative adenylylsulfate reductase-associated electron transfer protein QmoB n=1 Tax=Desulfovibrio litoralis DSM 11393 TaxID=1121455 RepID=A0A1M7RZS2_9BACT|nr:hydrogenase iron-sulfur subunit [Desulfovibrio litoralis]SHN51592.1 putative adenylylsulfate reductase-associated electron transfer protein QmoB [Desulfovibrio litoralis DSM 11393]
MATKLGVYFDQSCITGGVDVDNLVSITTKKWNSIAPVIKALPSLANEEAHKEILSDIEENELDGLLICGSSPRVDWDIHNYGNILVERVNLREQGVLCYQNPDGSEPQPDSAPQLMIEMLEDYINMGVQKLQKTNKPSGIPIEAIHKVMVLGGGWTGLSAVENLVKSGYEVILVEKDLELGGKVRNFVKTIPITPPYAEVSEIDLNAKVNNVRSLSNVQILTNASLEKLSGEPGEYLATIKTENGTVEEKIGSVVLATGWVPQNPETLAPMGYGKFANVVTASEFEVMVKDGKLNAKRVAFLLNTDLIQDCASGNCEGNNEQGTNPESSKDGEEANQFVDLESKRHLAYSRGVSSLVALKQAGYVADSANDAQAYIIYDSIVVQGVHERFYKNAQNKPGIMMTKAEIVSINEDNSELLIEAKDTLIGTHISLAVDLIVLPTGIVPTTAKSAIMNFDYRQGPAFPDLDLFNGFADSNYICFPYETRRTGVYAAGCVRQPMTLDAAEEDAAGASLKAIQCIESSNRGVAVHPRSGDLSYPIFNMVRCTQCKRCTQECPFGALDDDEKGTPKFNPSRCRRCGTCMGACPERVISFENYNIDQIGSMIREIRVPENMAKDGPRVLILACENDAYPALDMAALRGYGWSPYVRIIPVRCLGSVNAIWVADAMSKGIDGVMLLGCKFGDDYQCHFVKGSEICSKRKENIAESLERLGIEADRVEQFEVAIDEYNQLPDMINSFMAKVIEKGPNPFKGY